MSTKDSFSLAIMKATYNPIRNLSIDKRRPSSAVPKQNYLLLDSKSNEIAVVDISILQEDFQSAWPDDDYFGLSQKSMVRCASESS